MCCCRSLSWLSFLRHEQKTTQLQCWKYFLEYVYIHRLHDNIKLLKTTLQIKSTHKKQFRTLREYISRNFSHCPAEFSSTSPNQTHLNTSSRCAELSCMPLSNWNQDRISCDGYFAGHLYGQTEQPSEVIRETYRICRAGDCEDQD